LRRAIISDIHANLEALETVLEDIQAVGVDAIYCLGDIVGYGPEPAECLHRVRKVSAYVVAGNHDLAVADKLSIDGFNVLAREATLWTRNELSSEDISYLAELPLVENLEGLDVVHSTLCSPELFDYIQTTYDAYLSLQLLENQVCFLGHSHVPITFFQGEMISYTLHTEITLEEGVRALVNIGSIGQPRDDNPRASFAIYDTDERKIWIKRIEYDIETASEKIRRAGLPEPLAERLKYGR